MKPVLLLCLWLGGLGLSSAQTAEAGRRDTFDARTQPLGRRLAGALDLFLPEEALVRALRPNFPKLGLIDNLEKQWIGDFEYLVFNGRKADALYQPYLVAVRLRVGDDGYYYAASLYQVCTSLDEEDCANCRLTQDGCRCFGLYDSFCGHIISNDFPFQPILLKIH